MNFPGRRTIAVSIVTLVATTSGVLLVSSAQTFAQTHKASCASSQHGRHAHSTARHERARACSQSERKRKAKAHAGHKRRKQAHRAKGKRSKAKTKKQPKRKTKAPSAALTAAKCEDESLPLREADGSFACDDGSDPACAGSSYPMLTSDGTELVCSVVSDEKAAELEEEGREEEEELEEEEEEEPVGEES